MSGVAHEQLALNAIVVKCTNMHRASAAKACMHERALALAGEMPAQSSRTFSCQQLAWSHDHMTMLVLLARHIHSVRDVGHCAYAATTGAHGSAQQQHTAPAS